MTKTNQDTCPTCKGPAEMLVNNFRTTYRSTAAEQLADKNTELHRTFGKMAVLRGQLADKERELEDITAERDIYKDGEEIWHNETLKERTKLTAQSAVVEAVRDHTCTGIIPTKGVACHICKAITQYDEGGK